MQIVTFTGDLATARTDMIVVGVYAERWRETSAIKKLDRSLKGALIAAARDEEFKGKPANKLMLNTLGKIRAKRVAVLGLGPADKVDAAEWLKLAGTATRLGNQAGAKQMTLVAPGQGAAAADRLELLARGAILGGYKFDRYRSDKGRAATVRSMALLLDGNVKRTPASAKAIRRGKEVADSVALARDLVNEPALELYPESFAKRAVAMARRVGLRSRVYGPAELKKMGMNLLLSVGVGSARPPRLVHLKYQPSGGAKSQKPLVLVGKGITFDSGGLCLKSPSNMMDMKVDMAGAAAVFGAMHAVAKLKPKTPVHGILVLAENMPSGTAMRLGDVIKSASGRTVEITNTDAEGRLVLADALHFACGLEPRRIIDIATLTGACVVALGPHTVGLFSDDDDLAGDIEKSAERAGESLWRMPLTAALKEQLKSQVADTKNTGERAGGAITAALFLSEFVGKIPWAHLDIAGPATNTKSQGSYAKGATGVAVATLAAMLG